MTSALKALCFALSALFLLPAVAAAQPQPTGVWLMQNGKAEVQITPCGNGALCGRVSRVIKYPKDGARTDIHNGDAKLRGRPLLGLPVLLDFRREGASWRGRVYDPKSGRAYRATLAQPDGRHLALEACLFVICKAQTWTRVQ